MRQPPLRFASPARPSRAPLSDDDGGWTYPSYGEGQHGEGRSAAADHVATLPEFQDLREEVASLRHRLAAQQAESQHAELDKIIQQNQVRALGATCINGTTDGGHFTRGTDNAGLANNVLPIWLRAK